MTQLIDLIEDINVFDRTEDRKDYYSGARSFRQIDESTIEAICHFSSHMGEFMIRTNLRFVTFEDVIVGYDRIDKIRFLSIDPINHVCECTCESSIDTDSIEVYASNYETKYQDALKRQVAQELVLFPEANRPANKLDQVIVDLKALEFSKDSSEVTKIK